MNQETILIPTLSTFIEDQWEMTKGITTPKFSGINDLLPNQEFQALILLGKYEIKDGKINLKINCSLENSSTGKVLPNSIDKVLLGDLEEKIGFILFPELLTFKFTEEDEEGVYNLILSLDDTNSEEEKIVIKQELTFLKSQPNLLQKPTSELEEWRQNYYLDPKPTALISYYFKGLEENDTLNSDASILFYVEALNNSLFLVNEIKSLLKADKFSRLQRNGLIILLARSKYTAVDTLGFSEEELKILHEFRDEFYNPLEKEISHPSELDMLWSLFFANGKYENIEKIISALYYKKDISEEEAKKLPQEALIKYAIGSAVSWSLETIGRFHPMVQVYMIYTLNQPNISEYIQGELGAVLNRINEE
ncbi:hypothetical protein [Kordia sp.]|uniref:hypothetical protein n=1 Tax=Kordia sp. TaxID=1965332 RepID=UPI003D6AEE49